MTSPTPATESDDDTSPAPGSDPTLHRRRFFRSGALLAAGGAAAAIATNARPAAAADGDALVVGRSYDATTTTSLTIAGNASAAALTLANPTGPVLQLEPVTGFSGKLPVGSLAATPGGILVGLEDDFGRPFTSWLVSANDLRLVPVSLPFGPGRVLNTADKDSLDIIVGASPGALDSKNRLRKKAWIDIGLLPTAIDSEIAGAFITVTSFSSKTAGSLTPCRPGDIPETEETLPFAKGATVATGTFVETAVVGRFHAIRIYARATTHLKLDVAGFTAYASFGGGPDPAPGLAAATQDLRQAVRRHLDPIVARARGTR